MAGLLFFLGLSLAGQFEIGLTLTSAGGSLAAKQGYAGSFFTGVLAVVVATPCTAPFMGAAIGYALAQPAAVTFAVFTALALGLAAPYVALTLQPAWTRLLPKPGAWMDILKQAISFPSSPPSSGWRGCSRKPTEPTCWLALLASFLLLAIAGWFLGRWPAKRWATTVAGPHSGCGARCVYCAQTIRRRAVFRFGPTFVRRGCCGQHLAALVRRRCPARAHRGPTCLCRLHRELVPELPGERARRPRPAGGHAGVCRRQRRPLPCRLDPRGSRDHAGAHRSGRSGVPVYALYTPGQSAPQLLPQVLTPGIVIDAVAKLPHGAARE
jgi:hypothetical protein